MLRVALVHQLVADLAGAQDHAVDDVAVELGAVVEHELERAVGERRRAGERVCGMRR